jgi:Lysine methyltransferase
VLWKVTPRFADWLCGQNPLFAHGVLTSASSVLELGCGVSGVLALTLGLRVGKYFLSDQDYVLRLLQRNLAENLPGLTRHAARPRKGRAAKGVGESNITTVPIDWETDKITRHHPALRAGVPFSAVIACDCIYNEALVNPFVETCIDACRSLSAQNEEEENKTPTVAIIAQELRSPDVFEAWLERFLKSFHTYRIPDSLLAPEIKSISGFSIHIGILRG